MREFGKVSPQFWIGKTGKVLRREGALAQLVALYLVTGPHANMLGLYYLPQSYITHDMGLPPDDAQRGLQACVASGFCRYDESTEVVWVCEMARWQIADVLKEKDLRVKGVQNVYDSLPANSFLPAFFERYGAAFDMISARAVDGRPVKSEAAWKHLASKEKEREKEKEKAQGKESEQESEQEAMRDGIAALTPTPTLSPRADSTEKNQLGGEQRQAVKSPLPENFGISDQVRKWAEQRHIARLDLHLEHFISTVRRNGYTYVDWDEALKVAIRKDWAELGKTSLANTHTASASKLGKAGQATANNAQRWLEDVDASR